MKHLKFALGVIMTLMLGCSTVVSAADAKLPTATFDGSDTIKYNYDQNNFGTNFQNMQPGEVRTQEIILRNLYDRNVNFFMKAETLKSFEDMEKASGAAYQVLMTVEEGNTTTTIYGGSEDDGSARIGGDTYGLKDMNGNMTDWFMIATLAEDEDATISLTVSLDGESHNNDYQDVAGTFAFEFQASYDDPETIVRTQRGEDRVERVTRKVPEATPTVTETPTTDIGSENVPTTAKSGPVQTGDTTKLLPYAAAGAAALLVILFAASAKRKKKN